MTANVNKSSGSLAMLCRSIVGLCAGATAIMPVLASAHPSARDHVHGLAQGFVHPLTGIDHVLAMVAVGMFAAHLGGRALWLVPLTFVSVMALAGVAGMVGVTLPLAEIGIGLSVVVLGLTVALQVNVPTLVAVSVVGFFAIFHGHAHGAEMPENMSGLTYGLGFVLATLLLHASGVALGILIGKTGEAFGRRLAQAGGAAIAIAGAAILISP